MQRAERRDGHDVPVVRGQNGRAREVGARAGAGVGHAVERALLERREEAGLTRPVQQRVRVAAADEHRVHALQRLQRLALPVQMLDFDAERLEPLLRPDVIVLRVGERGRGDEPDTAHVVAVELAERPTTVLEERPP